MKIPVAFATLLVSVAPFVHAHSPPQDYDSYTPEPSCRDQAIGEVVSKLGCALPCYLNQFDSVVAKGTLLEQFCAGQGIIATQAQPCIKKCGISRYAGELPRLAKHFCKKHSYQTGY
ncbi:hypothetical protein HIM_01833 [Hirsutella minnesotensis 3608]|nr:hypothetical protein HIM_01833 [Hirsutella minnesotensis 3608]